jgi:ribose transport system ATP-binding protein
LSETERLIEVVKDLKSDGVSVIYISHRLGEVKELADRVVVLRDGRNAGGLSREAISHDGMVRMMVGRDLKDFYVHPEGVVHQPCFEVRDLRTRRYSHRAVSFKVNKGEIVGFAGLVGAGRSELAQAIFGVDPAVSGDILLEDRLVKIQTPKDAIGKGIYLIPEDRRKAGLILEDSIRKNITLPSLVRYASAGLINFESERKAASSIFKKLNVKAPSVEERVGNLSGGNQQKVVLAKWLSLSPHVLIFDEPTRGIDVGAKAEIYELMRGLAESGVAIMMISSDMEEILGVSERVAVMHEGRLSGVLERSSCNEEAIMRLAVGRG